MSHLQFSMGDIARLYLDLISAGSGTTGASCTIAIQRLGDGKWYRVSDHTWQSSEIANAMTELDSTNLPGRYYFDFDQTKDNLVGTRYIARYLTAGVMQYDDLLFGPLARAVPFELCSIQGTILSPEGTPAAGQEVRATIYPTFTDSLGRTVQNSVVARTFTDNLGEFDLPIVRGIKIKLEIDAVGYARIATVPDQSSVQFTDL